MRIKMMCALAASAYAILWTQLVQADTLNIVIQNITKQEGILMIQVMSSEAEFNGEDGVAATASYMQRAQGEAITISTTLPAGTYGVRIMHDVNGNQKLDTNFVGMPTEPFAFSNNAMGSFGPPKWKDVAFTLENETTQTITLN